VIRNFLFGLYSGISIYVLRITPDDLSRYNCHLPINILKGYYYSLLKSASTGIFN